MRNKDLKTKKSILLAALMLIISLVMSSAANDPGHDTLYIEEDGDSELNGSFNVSDNMKTKGNQTIQGLLYQGSNLDIRGDGDESGSKARIIGAAGFLSFQSPGPVYINTQSGTTSSVYFGNGADNVNINLTGALYFGTSNELDISAAGVAANSNLYWGDKLLCNASQSNCGWVTSTSGGGDITDVLTSTDDYLYNGSATGKVVLRFNETKLNSTIEAKSSSSGGGWTDLGTTINLTTPSNNVSANTLFIDNANNRVGIGTSAPDTLMDIQSSTASNQLRVSYDDSNYGNISVNSAGNMTIKATGHVIIDLS